MDITIPISLPSDLIAGLDAIARTDGTTRDETIVRAVRAYLAERRFDEIRERVVPQARRAGFFSDEDVFRSIS